MSQASNIRHFLVQQVKDHPHNLVAITAQHFAVSRTTVLRHIQTLVASGKLIKTGTTKQITYMLANAMKQTLTFTLDPAFDEFEIFTQHIAPAIKQYVNTACFDIVEYTVTEILNNAKDHSRGQTVQFTFKIGSEYLSCSCQDNGIGVFENLQQALGFLNVRDTLLQLSKGKLTSDTKNHTVKACFLLVALLTSLICLRIISVFKGQHSE